MGESTSPFRRRLLVVTRGRAPRKPEDEGGGDRRGVTVAVVAVAAGHHWFQPHACRVTSAAPPDTVPKLPCHLSVSAHTECGAEQSALNSLRLGFHTDLKTVVPCNVASGLGMGKMILWPLSTGIINVLGDEVMHITFHLAQ